MKNNISNLIKSVLEENALQFQNEATKILYSKVANVLKNEYTNTSKNMFNISEDRRGNAQPRLRPAPAKRNNETGGGFLPPNSNRPANRAVQFGEVDYPQTGGGLLPQSDIGSIDGSVPFRAATAGGIRSGPRTGGGLLPPPGIGNFGNSVPFRAATAGGIRSGARTGGGLLPGQNSLAQSRPTSMDETDSDYPTNPPALPNPSRYINPFLQGPIQQNSGGITPPPYTFGANQ